MTSRTTTVVLLLLVLLVCGGVRTSAVHARVQAGDVDHFRGASRTDWPARVPTYTRVGSRDAGATAVSDPWLWLDEPAENVAVNGPFRVGGWAFDPAAAGGTGVDAVHVWAYPSPGSGTPPIFVGAATYGYSRADVGDAFGSQYTNSGFRLQGGLGAGTYLIAVFAHSELTDSFSAIRTALVTIANTVRIVVDGPRDGAMVRQRFALSGWALDFSATADSGVDAVHVWAYPAEGGSPLFLGSAAYGRQARPDVASAFGPQYGRSGWALTAPRLTPGTYDLVCFPHRTATATFSPPARVRLTVTASGY